MTHYLTKYAVKLSAITLIFSALLNCGGSGSGDDDSTDTSTNTSIESADVTIQKVASDTVNHFIIPAYSDLAQNASAFAAATQTYCVANLTQAHADQITASYHTLQDSWMRAQINFLPIHPSDDILASLDVWIENTSQARTTTKIDELLNQGGPYTQLTIANYGTAVQGIPAIEYLLFGRKQAPASILTTTRCELLTTVARYVATLSQSLNDAWLSTAGNYGQHLIMPSASQDYATPHDVLDSLLNTPYIALEIIINSKLSPTTSSLNSAEKSESWRSQRSLKNVRINLEGLIDFMGLPSQTGLTAILTLNGQTAELARLQNHLQIAIDTLKASETQPINHSEQTLTKTIDHLRLAIDLFSENFMPALNVTPNFNSFDGD